MLHQTYARECFTNRLYWYFFLANTFWGLGFAVVSFRVFFAQSVGLNLDQFGKLMGGVGIASAILLYPAGVLADRWHPLRVMILLYKQWKNYGGDKNYEPPV